MSIQLQETPKAVAAFREYCLLGMDRSLVKLEAHLHQISPKSHPKIDTLKRWSAQHHWQERVRTYDEEQAMVQEQAIAAEKAKILTHAYALMHKRVELLVRKVEQLATITDDEDGIWVSDVKSVGTGPNALRVDLVQFNDAAFRELREYLTDIADEMGERVKTTKQEHTGKSGGPIEVIDPDRVTLEQKLEAMRASIEAGKRVLDVDEERL